MISSTIIEQSRALFEDVERLEAAIAQEMKKRHSTQTGRVLQQHRIKNRLDLIVEKSKRQKVLIEDKDGAKKQEVTNMSSGNVFTKFYESLRDLRESHAKHSIDGTIAARAEENIDSFVRFIAPDFSGEESYGRYLDLHEHHNRWINLKMNLENRIDYYQYVESFNDFSTIPITAKNAEYEDYLDKLLAYLKSFHKRAFPLQSDQQLKQMDTGFEERWAKGEIPGWKVQTTETENPTSETEKNDTNDTNDAAMTDDNEITNAPSAKALEDLGLERLKEELQKRGLKIGGTLEQRAERLFAVRNLSDAEIPPALRAGKSSKAKALTQDAVLNNKRYRRIAQKECEVMLLADMMQTTVALTAQRITKNMSRTYAEIEAQIEEEEKLSEGEVEEEEEEEDEDDDRPVHNPLNIPLGYDGKPIPYWLYKLHGLGIEYNCEICGNFKYKGRRAFERHFQEWRHTHNMRSLKIPNTKHFHEITSIVDAMNLYEKIKADLMVRAWKPEVEEEFEDTQGNVLNKKTYDDLRRMGML